MITNNINLVELIASEGNMLCDLEEKNTFKKVICKQSEIENFKEITEERAKEIELEQLETEKEQEENKVETQEENKVDALYESDIDSIDGVIEGREYL